MKTFVVRGSCCVVLALLMVSVPSAQRAAISDKPDTPFKLATFEAAGKAAKSFRSAGRS